MLAAAHIVDHASQQRALTALQAVATVVSSMLALVQSVSSPAEVARMAADSTIKLAAVTPYMEPGRSAGVLAAHYSEPVSVAEEQIGKVEQQQSAAGF